MNSMGRRASVRAPATSPNASWFLLTAVTGRPESPPLDEGRVACRPGRVAAPPGESPLHPVTSVRADPVTRLSSLVTRLSSLTV